MYIPSTVPTRTVFGLSYLLWSGFVPIPIYSTCLSEHSCLINYLLSLLSSTRTCLPRCSYLPLSHCLPWCYTIYRGGCLPRYSYLLVSLGIGMNLIRQIKMQCSYSDTQAIAPPRSINGCLEVFMFRTVCSAEYTCVKGTVSWEKLLSCSIVA